MIFEKNTLIIIYFSIMFILHFILLLIINYYYINLFMLKSLFKNTKFREN